MDTKETLAEPCTCTEACVWKYVNWPFASGENCYGSCRIERTVLIRQGWGMEGKSCFARLKFCSLTKAKVKNAECRIDKILAKEGNHTHKPAIVYKEFIQLHATEILVLKASLPIKIKPNLLGLVKSPFPRNLFPTDAVGYKTIV